MATIYKPPVIVPRREDLPYWLGVPLASNILINLTQQQVHGQGGQPPTPFWQFNWDGDVRTYNWPPQASNILFNLTQQKEFSAGGQVPTKFWRWDWDSDARWWNAAPVANPALLNITPFAKLWRYDWDSDVRTYNWPPQASDVLVNLTQQKEYGQGGQAPTKLWRYDWDSDARNWNAAPVANPALLDITPFAKFWRYDLDTDARLWFWQPPYVSPGVPNPFSKFWRYDNVPDTLWTTGPKAAPFNILGGQVPTKFWRWDYDSGAAQWTWTAPGSDTLDMLVEGGEPFNKFWRYDIDTDTRQWSWQGPPVFIPDIPTSNPFSKLWRYDNVPDTLWTIGPQAAPFNVLGGQVPTKFWRYDYDSGVTQWTWAAPGSNTLDELVEGGAPFHKLWRYDVDTDTRQWAWPSPPVSEPLLASAVSPFFKFWRYDFVPLPDWLAAPLNSYSLTLTSTEQKFFAAPGQVPTKFWRYDWDSDSHQWTWPGTTPFIPDISTNAPFAKLWRSDPEINPWWQGVPSANPSVLNIEPFAKFWRYDVDTNSWWQGSPSANQPVLNIEPAAKFWRYDLDTNTFWLGAPEAAPFNILGGKVPTKFWRYDHVPDPTYLWLPPVGLPIATTPPPTFLIPNSYRLWSLQWRHVPEPVWRAAPVAIPAPLFAGLRSLLKRMLLLGSRGIPLLRGNRRLITLLGNRGVPLLRGNRSKSTLSGNKGNSKFKGNT